jgi:hypothetical protein
VADRSASSSKKLASQRQIETAIQQFDKGAFECAVTLAHAGENILNEAGLVSLFERLKEAIQIDHNELPNWLKHGTGPDTRTITELEVVVLVQRAISKFVARFNGATPAMKAFSEAQRNKLEAEKKESAK